MNQQRRTILRLGSAFAVLPTFGHAQTRKAHDSQRLVVVFLRGAMDGLSMLSPYGESEYFQYRANIAIAKPGETHGSIALNNLFGLHPSFANLMPFWDKQQLAFVHACGSPDPTRSHFDAQDYMESGTPGRKSTQDGWMNRLTKVLHGDSETSDTARLQAINLGPNMPRIFAGDAAIASLGNGDAAIVKGVLERPDIASGISRLYSGNDKLSTTVREASETRREIINTFASDDPKADIGGLALNGLPRDAARLGQLMARDARVRLAFIPVAGWDTHVNQGNGQGQLASRFSLLSEALAGLAHNLGDAFRDTSILVLSEFGRTVRQNGTTGTDHGHGNVAMLLGGRVKGGQVAGQWPGLGTGSLYENRDLAITTDFRSILADVLGKQFALSDKALSSVLPGFNGASKLGLIRG